MSTDLVPGPEKVRDCLGLDRCRLLELCAQRTPKLVVVAAMLVVVSVSMLVFTAALLFVFEGVLWLVLAVAVVWTPGLVSCSLVVVVLVGAGPGGSW